MKERLLKIGAEAGMICFSVFLAFWLNELRQDYGKEQDTLRALNAIKAEITSNKAILEKWLPYHQQINEKVANAIAQGSLPVPFDQTQFTDDRGIFRELLTSTARRLLNSNNIDVHINKRLMIERVYEQQSFVVNAHQTVFDFVESREVMRPELSQENYLLFQHMMLEIHEQQRAMIYRYEKILNEAIWPVE